MPRCHAGGSWISLVLVFLALPAGGQELMPGLDLPGAEHVLEITMGDEDASGFAGMPVRYSSGELVEILDPAGYRMILTDADSKGEELVFPAGELTDPPQGRWRMWLEGHGTITPFSDIVIFRGRRPKGQKTLHPLPVVPGGRVSVERTGSDGLELRVVWAGGDHGTRRGHELSRRRRVGDLGKGILMPAGAVVAALWDPKTERYLELTRPFDVEEGRTIPAPLERPRAGRAHLVAYVDRPPSSGSKPFDLSQVALRVGERSPMAPHLTITTRWGVYAFWYDLDEGTVTIQGGSDDLYLEPRELRLQGGRVERFQDRMKVRPFREDP